MNTQHQTTNQPNGPAQTEDQPSQQSGVLDRAIDATVANLKSRRRKLETALDFIEKIIPPQLKGHGERLIDRCITTLRRKPEMLNIPEEDLVRCVCEAAEVGMVIDGKFGYIVKYKNTYQFQADYKGLVVSMRRYGIIKDCYADVVGEADDFRAYRENDTSYLHHEYAMGESRGAVIGAYAVVILPSGVWRFEMMDVGELNRIQARAPSKNGPWATDINEMRKKTVIRRCLKMYIDDPAAVQALAEPWEDGAGGDAPVPLSATDEASVRTTATRRRRSLPQDDGRGEETGGQSTETDQTPPPDPTSEPNGHGSYASDAQRKELSDLVKKSGVNKAWMEWAKKKYFDVDGSITTENWTALMERLRPIVPKEEAAPEAEPPMSQASETPEPPMTASAQPTPAPEPAPAKRGKKAEAPKPPLRYYVRDAGGKEELVDEAQIREMCQEHPAVADMDCQPESRAGGWKKVKDFNLQVRF